MQLEGKVLGYDKKVVAAVAYTLIIILIAFYAGAKYEKSKLTSLARQKSVNSAPKQAGSKKAKAAVNQQETSASQNTATTTATTPTPATSAPAKANQPAGATGANVAK